MKKRFFAILALLAIILCSFSGCTHYCSYGGCMNEVDEEGARCSLHEGLDNDPHYGVPASWQ